MGKIIVSGASGNFDRLTDDAERISGRPPKILRDIMMAHMSAWPNRAVMRVVSPVWARQFAHDCVEICRSAQWSSSHTRH